MTYRTESDMSRAIRGVAEARGWFWERFEDSGSRGESDAYLGAGAARCWIELKIVASPAERPRYRPGQLGWGLRCRQRGEPCVTLCAAPGGFVVYDTGAVALAVVFEEPWPKPLGQAERLEVALAVCLSQRERMAA